MDQKVELEELEPLFDYSRMQPVNPVVFNDESMDFLTLGGKRNKRKCGKVENKDDECIVVDLDGEDNKEHTKMVEDEEDWLPLPPPPMPIKSKTLPRDSKVDETLNELRLKKKELTAFAHSSKAIMNEAIKAAKEEIHNSKSAAAKSEPQEQVKVKPQQVERPKIIVSIQGKDVFKQFRVNKDEKLDKLFKAFAERVKLNFESLAFCFDGEKIHPGATPASLDMDDEDIIEMLVKSH